MENLAENNKLIELLENLYDAKFLKKPQVEDPKTKLDKEMAEINNASKKLSKINLFVRFTKNTTEDTIINDDDNKEVIDAYRALVDYVNENILSKQSQDFWVLWKFCQFVRFAEKILLYENDPESNYMIYVDSGMKNDEEPAFTIKTPEYRIFIKMQLISKANLGLNNFTESAYNQIITIMINRNYGKKMSNKFIVIDGEVDLEDDSDLYLVNQINKAVNYSIQNTITNILESLLTVDYINSIGTEYVFKNYYKM